jgi:hypothetical protein
LRHLSRHEAWGETWRQAAAKFPADVAFDADPAKNVKPIAGSLEIV